VLKEYFQSTKFIFCEGKIPTFSAKFGGVLTTLVTKIVVTISKSKIIGADIRTMGQLTIEFSNCFAQGLKTGQRLGKQIAGFALGVTFAGDL